MKPEDVIGKEFPSGNGNSKGKDKSEPGRDKGIDETQFGFYGDGNHNKKSNKKQININKYTGNGRLPLHESVVIGDTKSNSNHEDFQTKFVVLKSNSNLRDFELLDSIKNLSEILTPKEQLIHRVHYLMYLLMKRN